MGLKLLIVEDEDTIRNGIYRYLRLHTERFEHIYLAENGETALNQILLYKPDIMLLDVQIPVKNGLEVMKETKKLGIMPITLILSGYNDFQYAQQALRYGARDYLLKPRRASEILNELLGFADEIEGRQEDLKEQLSCNTAVMVAEDYIKEHYNENISLAQLSDIVGISAGYLSTLFSQNLGCGFIDYLNTVRVENASTFLKQNYFKTYEIAFKVGFKNEKYFSRVFKKIKGITPADYRKNHKKGDEIF